MAGRRRRLKPDERDLWTQVTLSVRPLHPLPFEDNAAPIAPPPIPQLPLPALAPRPTGKSTARQSPAPDPSPGPLERRERQRLARGTMPIEARLDLHGRTQAEAFDILLAFLSRAQSGGARAVLVITGKGAPGSAERGVLRRQVPLWLALPAFRSLVIGFDSAGRAHGGEGALYIRLRRRADD